MKNKIKKLSIIISIIFAFILLSGFSNYPIEQNILTELPSYTLCYITGEIIEDDYKVYSTTTLEDNFTNDKILVVLKRQVSRDFREFTVKDFPEIELLSVECITPGLELAYNQLRARASGYNYNESININYFRRFLVLTLAVPSRQNVLNGIQLLEARTDIRSASANTYSAIESASNDYIGLDSFMLNPLSLPQTNYNLWNLNRI